MDGEFYQEMAEENQRAAVSIVDTGIPADLVDYRLIKGRKVLQITAEVPIEYYLRVINYLGAPNPEGNNTVHLIASQVK